MLAQRAILALLILGLLLGMAWFWRDTANERALHHATLPGGLTLEYLGTAHGNTSFDSETKWQRIAREILPAKWSGWLPTPWRTTLSPGSNALTVFVRAKGPAGSFGAKSLWSSARAVGDDGAAYPASSTWKQMTDAAKGMIINGMSLQSFPRRQSDFWYEVLDSASSRMARFRVNNPVAGQYPVWKAPPLPQTVTNGPVELTLRGLAMQTNASGIVLAPQFNIASANLGWANARPFVREILDATGNQSSTFLPPTEPAWKIQMVASRQFPGDFAADEIVLLRGLSVPDTGKIAPMDVKTNIAGVELNVLGLVGDGVFSISNGIVQLVTASPPSSEGRALGRNASRGGKGMSRPSSFTGPGLIVDARGLSKADFIEYLVTDDEGAKEKVSFDKLRGSTYRLLHLHAALKGLTIQLGINTSLPFEFMVNPAQALSNAPGSRQAASSRR